MKKIFYSLAGVLLISITLAEAQQQDTSLRQESATPVQQPTPPAQPTPPSRVQDQYRHQDRVLVPQDQLPLPMRETLLGNQYKGWENSSIYQDRTTGEYSLDIRNSTQTPRTYRFDKSGKLIEDPNKPKQGIDNDQ
jgi:hypothetical protein